MASGSMPAASASAQPGATSLPILRDSPVLEPEKPKVGFLSFGRVKNAGIDKRIRLASSIRWSFHSANFTELSVGSARGGVRASSSPAASASRDSTSLTPFCATARRYPNEKNKVLAFEQVQNAGIDNQ